METYIIECANIEKEYLKMQIEALEKELYNNKTLIKQQQNTIDDLKTFLQKIKEENDKKIQENNKERDKKIQEKDIEYRILEEEKKILEKKYNKICINSSLTSSILNSVSKSIPSPIQNSIPKPTSKTIPNSMSKSIPNNYVPIYQSKSFNPFLEDFSKIKEPKDLKILNEHIIEQEIEQIKIQERKAEQRKKEAEQEQRKQEISKQIPKQQKPQNLQQKPQNLPQKTQQEKEVPKEKEKGRIIRINNTIKRCQ
jgi:hypothetical protein